MVYDKIQLVYNPESSLKRTIAIALAIYTKYGPRDLLISQEGKNSSWDKLLRMQGHRLPATLEVTGLNPGPGRINLIKIEKHQRDS
jgi:hypothetical protein